MSRSSGALIGVGVVTVAVSAVLACSDNPVTAVIECAREQTPAPSPTWSESVWNRADNREYPPETTSWSLYCALHKAVALSSSGARSN